MGDLSLKRCMRCILPETLPGILFDDKGICNLCTAYQPTPVLGEDNLMNLIPLRGNRFDCIVPISGGKDSIFVLYYAVRKLGLNILAVNYDSGFQSALSIRNMQNACSRLGVPLITYRVEFSKRNNIVKEALGIAECVGFPEGICNNCGTSIRAATAFAAKKYSIKTAIFGLTKFEHITQIPTGLLALTNQTPKNKLRKLVNHFIRLQAAIINERRQLKLPLPITCNSFKAYTIPNDEIQSINFFDFFPWTCMEETIVKTLGREVGWEHPENKMDRFDCAIQPLLNFMWLKKTNITLDGLVYANMVRGGILTRLEALTKEQTLINHLSQQCLDLINRYDWNKDIDNLDWLKII